MHTPHGACHGAHGAGHGTHCAPQRGERERESPSRRTAMRTWTSRCFKLFDRRRSGGTRPHPHSVAVQLHICSSPCGRLGPGGTGGWIVEADRRQPARVFTQGSPKTPNMRRPGATQWRMSAGASTPHNTAHERPLGFRPGQGHGPQVNGRPCHSMFGLHCGASARITCGVQ